MVPWLLLLPYFCLSFSNLFLDNQLIRYYLEDVCQYHGTTSCITTAQLSTVNFVQSIVQFILDLFMAQGLLDQWLYFLMYKKRISFFNLLFLYASVHSICYSGLFSYFISDPSLRLISLFSFQFVKNQLFNLNQLYTIVIQRVSSSSTLFKEKSSREEFFAWKHVVELIGGVCAGFMLPFLSIAFKIELGSHFSHFTYATGQSFFIILVFLFLRFYYSNSMLNSSETNTQVERANNNMFLSKSFEKSVENCAFVNLLLLFCFESFRGLLWNGLYGFYMSHVLQLRSAADYNFWSSIFHMVGMFTAMLFTPFWIYLTKKWGTYFTYCLSYLLEIFVGASVYFLVSKGQVYRYLILFILNCAIGRSSGFLLDSIKSRVFDYDELLHFERRETSMESIWSLLPRIIGLPSTTISFYLLTNFGGYTQTEQDYQNEKLIHMISIQTVLLPCITALVCFWIKWKFPIDSEAKSSQIKELLSLRQKYLEAKTVEQKLQIKDMATSQSKQYGLIDSKSSVNSVRTPSPILSQTISFAQQQQNQLEKTLFVKDPITRKPIPWF